MKSRIDTIMGAIIIALIMISTPLTTAAKSTENDLKSEVINVVDIIEHRVQKDSVKVSKSQSKNVRLSGMGGPGYNPDYGFIVGGSALMTFKMPKMESSDLRSVLPLTLSMSFGDRVQWSVIMKPQFYMKDDWMRFMGEFSYINVENNYHGVGYVANKYTPRGSTTTEYFNSKLTINPTFLFRLSTKSWFLGPTFHLQQDKISDPSKGVINDIDYIKFGGNASGLSTLNSGIGFALNYDSRDLPSNAYSGVYFDFNLISFGEYFGGDYNYQQLHIKYRQYVQLSPSKRGRTLAWSFTSDNVFGDVPFTLLSTLGSAFDLRGYYQGQYRDKSAHVALVEYRHKFNMEPVNFVSKIVNRLGFATWMGSGLLGPSPFKIEGALPNFGAGLRFEVQPRMNFRVDVGYSPIEKQTLFYLNMTEAF